MLHELNHASVYLSLALLGVALLGRLRCPDIGWLTIPCFFLQAPVIELAWVVFAIDVIYMGWLLGTDSSSQLAHWLSLLFTAAAAAAQYRTLAAGCNAQQEARNALQRAPQELQTQALNDTRAKLLRTHVPASAWLCPFRLQSPAVEIIKNLAYGEQERQQLDIYRPRDWQQAIRSNGNRPLPVLLQVHGGGWMVGNKEQQARPLMDFLAQRGWLCVAINYRLSPAARFPDHLLDVKRALHWIKTGIRDFGGDPQFVATTGGSAGGHLCSLLALTANRSRQLLQPGFETADSSVQACVPFYGVYDFLDRHNSRPKIDSTKFYRDYVMPEGPESAPELWQLASPIAQVDATAPPFMVVHGSFDSLSYVEDARHFVQALGSTSTQPVLYLELAGAQHAFELFHSPRTEHTINAVQQFLEAVYSRHIHPPTAPQPEHGDRQTR
ncbi:MAG: alpha/beta hydrolase [Gammaproteobacteria bacterium]|nr:alpha/beta hydrolase [Gammaproteobacteria bacterium]